MPTDGWRRNLAAMWVAQTMTAVAFSFVLPFIPLYVQVLGIEGTNEAADWAAFISAAAALSMTIAQPIWGNMADRWGRKPMVVRSMIGGSICIFLMGLATSPEQLLVLRFIQGSVTGVVAAATALVASSTPKPRLGFALGLMQVAMFGGTSIGPLIGGFIADTFGYRASFYSASALMMLGGVLTILFVRERFARPPTDQPRQGVWAGNRSVLAIGFFPLLIGVVFLIQLGGVIVSPVLSLFIAELHEGENAATAAGLVLAATGVVSAISAIIIGRLSDRVPHTVILPVCLLGAAVSYFPQAFVQQVWQLLLLRMLLGAFLGGLMPTANAMVARLVPEERRGAAYGLTSTANALANGVGPLMAAAITTSLGMRAVFLATGAFFALDWAWVTMGFRKRVSPRLEADAGRVAGRPATADEAAAQKLPEGAPARSRADYPES
ncbi:MAG: MFS transporter [Bacteroidetes bacterium]|nr:MFS transporter [Bacteroidota bacterium]MCL5025981.1 MFS transporter [Chloroflexota bacterium]